MRSVGNLLTCGQNFIACFRIPLSAWMDSNFIGLALRHPIRIPQRGARSVSPPACTGCVGQWSAMLVGFFRKTSTPSAFCQSAVKTSLPICYVFSRLRIRFSCASHFASLVLIRIAGLRRHFLSLLPCGFAHEHFVLRARCNYVAARVLWLEF